MEKKCNKCGVVKDLEASFHIKKHSKEGKPYYKSICKSCTYENKREKRRQLRRDRPELFRRKTRKTEEERRESLQRWNQLRKQKIAGNREWLIEYKKTCSCKSCGLSFKDCYWLVDFHHRDPSTKENVLSDNTFLAKSREVIETELVKCDTLCANCHRTYHHLERTRG